MRTGQGNHGTGVDSDTGRNAEAQDSDKPVRSNTGADKEAQRSGQKDDKADHGGESDSARSNMKVETVPSISESATSPGGASATVKP